MKYLIISDNHGDEAIVENLIKNYEQQVDKIIHCGDLEMTKDNNLLKKLNYVKGNCDFEKFPNEIVIESENDKIFVTHGHLYGVNFDLMKLKYKALELGCNLVCFGHTHVPLVEKDENILLINPGSISQPRIYPPIPTYVILESLSDKYVINYYNRNDEKVDLLSKIIMK